MKYKAGEYVYYPWTVDWHWDTHFGKIIDVEDEGYYIEVSKNNMANNDPPEHYLHLFKEREVFTSKGECDEYIDNYYYDSLCIGCEYENTSLDGSCKDCTHTKEDRERIVCDKNGLIVGNKYKTIGFEVCSAFLPSKPCQITFKERQKVLKECYFNKNCDLHRLSCHKTCSYDRYLAQLVSVFVGNLDLKVQNRAINYIKVTRNAWIDQKFYDETGFLCNAIQLEPELTKTGKPKKKQVKGLVCTKGGKIGFDGGLEGDWEEY